MIHVNMRARKKQIIQNYRGFAPLDHNKTRGL